MTSHEHRHIHTHQVIYIPNRTHSQEQARLCEYHVKYGCLQYITTLQGQGYLQGLGGPSRRTSGFLPALLLCYNNLTPAQGTPKKLSLQRETGTRTSTIYKLGTAGLTRRHTHKVPTTPLQDLPQSSGHSDSWTFVCFTTSKGLQKQKHTRD